MRRGLPWIVLLLALLAASVALQNGPSPKPGPDASIEPGASTEHRGSAAPDILDGAFPDSRTSDIDVARPPTAMAPGDAIGRSDLPPEAHATLRRIVADGPFPYRQDGDTFGNRERLLPPRARGWYREYTVDTPGSRDRGARRIVTGGDPPSEFFYSGDHYRSFRRIDAQGRAQ